MPARVIVAVSYHRDESVSPRTGRGGDPHALYWANIAVNAATLKHVAGPDVDFAVFTGEQPPSPADRVLADVGGDVRILPFAHEPPRDFYGRYAGSLYVLDSLASLAAEVDDDTVVLLVDPDIVWARSPDPLVQQASRGVVVGYDLDVPDDVPMCGLTRRRQGEIATALGAVAATGGAPVHFGGEVYGMTGNVLRTVQPRLEDLWQATLERYRRGEEHFVVEEHLMNAVLWERGEQDGLANPHVQRIRTLPEPFSTRERFHDDLVAWHLPFEKHRAFPRLLRHLARGRELPAPGPAYRSWLATRMGITPGMGRRVVDRAHRAKWRLERRGANDRTHLGL